MGEEYVILNKDKICFCSHSLTFPAVSALPVADSGKADGVSEAMPPNTVYPIASDSGFSQFKQQYNKKKFFLFLPSHPTFRLKRPIYRGFKGEGKCEGK